MLGTARGHESVPAVASRRAFRLFVVVLLVLAWLLAAPDLLIAAGPEPSAATGGDPRSSGQGPGFVGDAPMAIGITLAIGLGALLVTYAYVRLTANRADE